MHVTIELAQLSYPFPARKALAQWKQTMKQRQDEEVAQVEKRAAAIDDHANQLDHLRLKDSEKFQLTKVQCVESGVTVRQPQPK